MRWSYRVARIAGIDVKIHITFLLLLAWFGWIYWQEGGLDGALQGISFTLLLFLCVLLHEFGHAFAARAYGIRTPDITLLPIGGVARLERMPDKPVQELVVAVAGPAVNVVIAAVLSVFLATKIHAVNLSELEHAGGNMVTKLLAVNVMLIVFNAIPAFPMDGGRVLRAFLAMKLDFLQATTIAARVGQVMAAGFVVVGFFGAPILMFIGIFVFMGAQQELAYARFRSGSASRPVGDIMRSEFLSVPADATVGAALAIARQARQPFYPVVGHDLRAIGVVTHGGLELAAARGRERNVGHAVEPAVHVQASVPVGRLVGSASPGTPVLVENPSGQLVGVVSFRA